MAQVLRLYIQMFLSYGLYVCIILETAHHRTSFRIFCNISQKTILSSLIVLFSYGKVDFFGIRIKFHLGRAKGRGNSGVYGKRAKMRCFFFFCKIPINKQDTYIPYLINCSEKLLTTTIVISMAKN